MTALRLVVLALALALGLGGCVAPRPEPKPLAGVAALAPELEAQQLAGRLGVPAADLDYFEESGGRSWGVKSIPHPRGKHMIIMTYNSVVYQAGGGGLPVPIKLQPVDLAKVPVDTRQFRGEKERLAIALALDAAHRLWDVPLDRPVTMIRECRPAKESEGRGVDYYVTLVVEAVNWRVPDRIGLGFDLQTRQIMVAGADMVEPPED